MQRICYVIYVCLYDIHTFVYVIKYHKTICIHIYIYMQRTCVYMCVSHIHIMYIYIYIYIYVPNPVETLSPIPDVFIRAHRQQRIEHHDNHDHDDRDDHNWLESGARPTAGILQYTHVETIREYYYEFLYSYPQGSKYTNITYFGVFKVCNLVPTLGYLEPRGILGEMLAHRRGGGPRNLCCRLPGASLP